MLHKVSRHGKHEDIHFHLFYCHVMGERKGMEVEATGRQTGSFLSLLPCVYGTDGGEGNTTII